MKRIILVACFGLAVGSCSNNNNNSATKTLSDSSVVNAADSGKMTITGTGANAAITDTGNQPPRSVTSDSSSQNKVSGVAGTGASDSISRSHK
jgi:hypothetical protein